MASQYAPEQKEFWQDCKADGGPIKILRPKSIQIDLSDETSDIPDPTLWAGTDDAPLETATFGLFFPGNSSSTPFTKCYIPGYDLDYALVKGFLVEDASTATWEVSEATPFNPDGQCVIFYDCKLALNPKVGRNA